METNKVLIGLPSDPQKWTWEQREAFRVQEEKKRAERDRRERAERSCRHRLGDEY